MLFQRPVSMGNLVFEVLNLKINNACSWCTSVKYLLNSNVDLRLLECNGFTYLKPSRGFKNLLLFKYMPFEDNPPHRFSQFLLF